MDNHGSNANTPRLPPSLNGKSDLEDIPAEPNLSLDFSEKPAPDLPLNMSSHAPQRMDPPPTSPSPILASLPGSGVHNRSKSALDLRVSLREQVQPIQPPLTDSALSTRAPPFLGGQQNPQPRSQDVWLAPDMSAEESPRVIRDGGLDRKGLAEARPEALSEKKRRSSSHHSSGRVDRQIEATMNDAEPSSNARSRKASHVLGLFRENKSPQDGHMGSRKIRSMSSEVMDDGSAQRAIKPDHPTRSDNYAYAAKHDEASGAEARKSHSAPLYASGHGEASSPENVRVLESDQQPPIPVLASVTNSETSNGWSTRQNGPDAHSNGAIEEREDVSATTAEIPANLLEEIRDYHNLAPPFHDKFRTTQTRSNGLPTGNTEVEQPAEPGKELTCHQKSDQQDKSSASPTDDDEESDKEHISSALYYPHQIPSPEALQDVSIDDARKARVAEDLEPQLPEPAITTADIAEEPLCEVDITLQSHNKSKYLHGDLQKARSSSGAGADYSQFIEGGTSSTSESEYESNEEHIHPSVHEDSSFTDDPDATPRASPTTRKSFLQSRFRKSHRKPKAPIGAVELKPYNHQVGGHSRVFRFSKRAVCKELSNRENVFYEAVEHQHPELLKFLPRYV